MTTVMKVKVSELECIRPRGEFLVDEFDIFFGSVKEFVILFNEVFRGFYFIFV